MNTIIRRKNRRMDMYSDNKKHKTQRQMPTTRIS